MAVILALSVSMAAQQGAPRRADSKWIPRLTADGHPDLPGMWLNNTAMPLERDRAFADKTFFTEDEALD